MTITASSFKAFWKRITLALYGKKLPSWEAPDQVPGTWKARAAGPATSEGASKGASVNFISSCILLATIKCINICEFFNPFFLSGQGNIS